MTIPFCLPIQKTTKNEIESILAYEASRAEYAYFEIWLDEIADLTESFITDISTRYGNKIVFLFRKPLLAHIQMALEERKRIIDLISQTSSFIDLDIATQKEELMYILQKNQNPNLIVSYHNYDATPGREIIEHIIGAMETYHPTIYKIATLCHDASDTQTLIDSLVHLQKKSQKYIITGMGDEGKFIRIFSMMQGNFMNFAPREQNEQSAPGQLTIKQLQVIYRIIKE